MNEKVVPLKWLTDYIEAIEKAEATCEQKLVLPELKAVKMLFSAYTGKRPLTEVPEDLQVSDFVPEFIEKLIEQLRSDHARWGNTWLTRPKEGQELRTKARYTDYFDMFEQAGTPVPWLKIVGGALICWIRENHPELCIDANECVDEGKPELREGSIEEYVKDQRRPIGTPASIKSPFDQFEEKPKYVCTCPDVDGTIKVLGHAGPCEGGKPEPVGVEGPPPKSIAEIANIPLRELTEAEYAILQNWIKVDIAIKAVELERAIADEVEDVSIQHKSDCAVYNSPPKGFASSVSECDCQDRNLPSVKDIVDPASSDGKATKETTDKVIVEAVKGSSRPNPVAHVCGEVLEDWNKGILGYAPKHENDGKLVRESIVFTTGSMGKEVVLAKCDKDGFIARGSEDKWIEGTMDNSGKYVISESGGFDIRVNHTLYVSYDYEYTLPTE